MSKISLIVTFYNAGKYALPCLNSIKNQTMPDFECICVNDGSTDSTKVELENFAKNDPRFIVINKENGGVSAARNTGLKNAKSMFIAFLDHDDMLHYQAFEILLYVAEKTNADIVNMGLTHVSDNFVIESEVEYDVTKIEIKDMVIDTLYKNVEIVIWNKLYKSEIVKDLDFIVGAHPGEDLVFTAKALNKAKTMVGIDEKLHYYRISQTSVIHSCGITEKYLKSYYLVAKEMHRYFISGKKFDNISMKSKISNSYAYYYCIGKALKSENKELMDLSHNFIMDLLDKKIFDRKLLSPKRKLVTFLFIYKYYKLAKYLM